MLARPRTLPLVVERNPLASTEVLLSQKAELRRDLLAHGAVLFRGFGVATRESFEVAVAALGGPTLNYVDGNSPRRKLGSGVYTSTEYPPEFFISLHNELSYSQRWPARLFFCCITPPGEGGETPLADSRAILRTLPPEVREAFVRKGIRYIRNLHGGRGFGPSWQATFETDSRAVVEEFGCTEGSEVRWNEAGGVSITQVRPATIVHPDTGEAVWFNQADQFHPSTHPKQIYDSILALYEGREELMPQTAKFGDGASIDPAMLAEVRRTAGEQMRLFKWEEGDLLVVDNRLVAHGRQPFKGRREILVSMTG
ncbi:MAG: TauD/TfdA family dioxygenase [Myxococcales bacterium]|nr:TauD/TfdA family dioxygenase [Myxococcales bacterium]